MDDSEPDVDDGNENEITDNNDIDSDNLDDGTVMEKAPNGGKDAWLIVLSCFGINLIVQVFASLVDIALKDPRIPEALNITKADAEKTGKYFNSLSDLYAPFAVLVMIKFGYKITVVVGSVIVCFSFTNMSMLGGGKESVAWYWKFWLCGPTAFGINFLKIGALIPVLENFTTKRMKALVLSRLGTSLGGLVTMGFIFLKDKNWRTVFRINAGLCVVTFAASFMLRNIGIKRKESDREEKEDNKSICTRIKEIFDPPVLKNRTFWIIMGIFFFFKFGITPIVLTLPLIANKLGVSQSNTILFVGIAAASIGNLGGVVASFFLKRLKVLKRFSKQSLMFMLTMVAISGPLIGICVVPIPPSYYVYVFINLVVVFFQVLSDNMRDESIPTVFGRPNIRITQSFLIMFVGVASLIAGGIQEGVEKNNEFGGWAINLQVGGSLLIVVGVVTATLIILHKKGEFKLLEEADVRSSNEYTNTKDKKQSETNGETKHESGDDLPKDNDKISMPVESGKLHSDDTQTGNYNRHAMPNRSKSRSTETPNTSSAQASCETERQEHVYGIPSRQSSIKRMNGNNGEHESDRMKSVYGLSPQRQSSKGMINKNVADQIPSDASMHHKKSNHYENVPGFPYAGKSLTGMRQPFPNNDPYKRTSASKTYVEEQMTNAGNPLY